MWKYRNSGIFSGWNGAVLVIALFTWLISFSFLHIPDWTGAREQPLPFLMYLLPYVLAAAVVLAGWLIFRRHVHDDDEYRQNPTEPEWNRLRGDSEIIEKMRETRKLWFIIILFISAVFLLILLVSLLSGGFGETEDRWIFAASSALALLFNLRNLLHWQFWRQPPEELEYTEIPVAYSMEQTYMVRGGARKSIKMFFFLPTGRYCVILNGVNVRRSAPQTLVFVRLHGVVRWIHWDDFS